MNDTFYRAFAPIPRMLRAAGLGGVYTVQHRSGGNTGAAAATSGGALNLTFIKAEQDAFRSSFPEVRLWKSDLLVYADLGTDLRKDDLCFDGVKAYTITFDPISDYGFVLGPAAVYAGAVAPVLVDGWYV